MSLPEVRVGLIDSGVAGSAANRVAASRSFRAGLRSDGRYADADGLRDCLAAAGVVVGKVGTATANPEEIVALLPAAIAAARASRRQS